jgi:hypothetical protein
VAFYSQPVREVVAGSGTAGIEDEQKKQTVPQALSPENCLESVLYLHPADQDGLLH